MLIQLIYAKYCLGKSKEPLALAGERFNREKKVIVLFSVLIISREGGLMNVEICHKGK